MPIRVVVDGREGKVGFVGRPEDQAILLIPSPDEPDRAIAYQAQEEDENGIPWLGLTEENRFSLVVDVSRLPGRVLVFALEPLLETSLVHGSALQTRIRLDESSATDWGYMPGHSRESLWW